MIVYIIEIRTSSFDNKSESIPSSLCIQNTSGQLTYYCSFVSFQNNILTVKYNISFSTKKTLNKNDDIFIYEVSIDDNNPKRKLIGKGIIKEQIIKKAKKEDWSKERKSKFNIYKKINLNIKLKSEDIKALEFGAIPESMDDKWFCYMEKDTVYFNRSWTNINVFICKFKIDKNNTWIIHEAKARVSFYTFVLAVILGKSLLRNLILSRIKMNKEILNKIITD